MSLDALSSPCMKARRTGRRTSLVTVGCAGRCGRNRSIAGWCTPDRRTPAAPQPAWPCTRCTGQAGGSSTNAGESAGPLRSRTRPRMPVRSSRALTEPVRSAVPTQRSPNMAAPVLFAQPTDRVGKHDAHIVDHDPGMGRRLAAPRRNSRARLKEASAKRPPGYGRPRRPHRTGTYLPSSCRTC
jgi:hypothetical protein